ncbi:hypothetical protein DEIPH_ctg008orf0075 [Deinococcus phoenicis]|uniref:Uncharacterized protein n=1 Tax=Deinococcus phoenicis TaxID=1476583 RepID=A0A016QTX9_9DEIO|nr:hypothetical protein DEIPH_ctg008orf0075 [Deinococcus phoenicis]
MLVLPLSLASCGMFGLPKGDVTGSITGTQPQAGDVRLALIGMTGSGFENNAVDQLDIGTFNPEKRVYAISLPANPKAGAYEVLAYVDTNKDNKYTAGEPRTRNQGRYLIFATQDAGLFGFNVKKGWNRADGTTVTQGLPFNNYDLSW